MSTRQLLVKIPNYPSLYRHSVNGTYYGIKKLGGKRKERSLDTTDRKIAERKLKEWINNLDKIDPEVEKTTLRQLLVKFETIRAGMSKSTKATEQGMIETLKRSWKYDLDIRVAHIKPSMLDEWLAGHEARLKNSSYNRYALLLKQLFEVAVADKIVCESPVAQIKKGWKRPQKVIRNVPTVEQWQAIVAEIRSQVFNADAEESADFVEFMGAAGLGQAEVSSTHVDDIDGEKQRIRVRRHKTGELFYVPIYKHLSGIVEKLQKKAQAAKRNKLFTIKSARKALSNACKRLGYKQFTQRNIRQVLIRRLWQAGVDCKLISKWQGHQDGGKLILNTYTEVFGTDDELYVQSQLNKIG